MTKPHTDSGFVTLLWQDGTGGLQAQAPDGGWVDVPPDEGGLVVNFGQMLGDWTGGRIRATPHRVLGGRAERASVPFFFEPAVDAVVAPLFSEEGGESFVYGDFLWARMTSFVNFHGVERKPAAAVG
jgi:isopenicillin N synthase-like dioxygenase